MPKQIHKIEQFHGGLNSGSDPRDITETEVSAATDIMVDELGKIRTLGGTTAHDAGWGVNSGPFEIEAGYGLFQFSHDRIYGYLGEHLNETDFATHDKWVSSGQADDTGGNLAFVFGSGTLDGEGYQTYSNRAQAGVNGVEYVFTYTVRVSSAPDYFSLTLQDFPASSTTLPYTNGTHVVTFTSHASASSRSFTINGTDDVGGTTTQGSFTIDNVSLAIHEASETGDDYLAFADDESGDPAIYIYSRVGDVWGSSQVITIGDDNSFAPAFYYVDGALRISDGNFGSSNINKWYGYIGRTLFPNINDGERISQWHVSQQSLVMPGSCYFDSVAPTVVDGQSMSRYPADDAASGTVSVEYDNGGGQPLDGWDNVYRVYVKIRAINSAIAGGGSYSYNLTVQDHASSPTHSETLRFPATGTRSIDGGETEEQTYTFYFDAANDDIDISGGETLNVDVTNITTINSTVVELSQVTAWEGVYSATSHTALTGNNVWLSFDDSAATGSGWDENWHVGVSFDIDGVQESKIVVAEKSSGTGSIILSGLASDKGVDCTVYFKWTRLWNKRITGINVYLRKLDANGNILSNWFKQMNINFITGKVETSSGIFEDIRLDTSQSEYIGFISDSIYTSPFLIESYQSSSGISEDDISIEAKYKTAVVVNRTVYIGNIEVQYDDGTKEVKGDAMIKTPVNKFDVFPLSRIIEASVRDGDNIVKLEEYADRILQFKKKKMHLINVSQEIEFLEDTFVHKGVSHPAATCKTDFGVAWVNNHGCYLYDGKSVTNLLEKGGRQIIKESNWSSFITSHSIIGYIPLKRQLVVLKDCTTSSNGDIFLYDMVTQSWVRGDSKFQDSKLQTNFVNDWDGDLIVMQATSGSGVATCDTFSNTHSDHTNGTVYNIPLTGGTGSGALATIPIAGGRVLLLTITDSGTGYVVNDTLTIAQGSIGGGGAETCDVATLTASVIKWDDTSDSTSTLDIKTKDFDFGQPGQRKKIYKVYISYKGDGDTTTVQYAVNGDTDTVAPFYRTTSDGSSDVTNSDTTPLLDSNTDDWILAELRPVTSINNVYSFQLQMAGTAESDFEINDMSVVYRLKGIK